MTLRALAASKPPLAQRSTHPPSVPLTSTVYSTTSVMPYTPQPLHPFRKKDRRNADWYEAHWGEMQPASEAKRQALLAYKHNSCVSTRDDLRPACSKAQQTACHCANDYWLNLCIQTAANSGDARGMYASIKATIGPTPIKTAPLKSKAGEVITDWGKQLECWVEHYLELYAIQNVVMDATLGALPSLPVMEELDALPSAEELRKTIDSLLQESPWEGWDPIRGSEEWQAGSAAAST
ncbi:unnamed protein product [Acanthosepion pharaonis]|uniref:Uncharacterized protein n=1 Tax=Acanthosepion pharaonis TaxID=158019 RepID=A0A812EWY4_ACAPH|nr:unnamed protein product [Sepia pharaonis]